MIELPYKSTFHLGVPGTLRSSLNIQGVVESIQWLAPYCKDSKVFLIDVRSVAKPPTNISGPSAFLLAEALVATMEPMTILGALIHIFGCPDSVT
jgi:hypothetical protein